MNSLFKPARQNVQATFKVGIFGEAGSGKTMTSAITALGFLDELKIKDPERAKKPVFFLDTESGSDFILPKFESVGHEVMSAKTRAFSDLIPALQAASKDSSILIIDSITHFWEEFTRSYAIRNRRTKGLQMLDWQYLKNEWGKFTNEFVAANCHIIMAGRAGFEYEFSVDEESGKKDMERTGVKMKGESSMAYEPNLLIYMQRQQEMDGKDVMKTSHTATIVKDRTDTIDGKTFHNPTFADFKPHVDCLALGGEHNSVDIGRTSVSFIPQTNGKTQWQLDTEEKERILEEIKDVLSKHIPGAGAADKEARAQKFEKHFGTRTWSRIEVMPLDVVKRARDALWLELEGKEYAITLPDHVAQAKIATDEEIEFLQGGAPAKADDVMSPEEGADMEDRAHEMTVAAAKAVGFIPPSAPASPQAEMFGTPPAKLSDIGKLRKDSVVDDVDPIR